MADQKLKWTSGMQKAGVVAPAFKMLYEMN